MEGFSGGQGSTIAIVASASAFREEIDGLGSLLIFRDSTRTVDWAVAAVGGAEIPARALIGRRKCFSPGVRDSGKKVLLTRALIGTHFQTMGPGKRKYCPG